MKRKYIRELFGGLATALSVLLPTTSREEYGTMPNPKVDGDRDNHSLEPETSAEARLKYDAEISERLLDEAYVTQGEYLSWSRFLGNPTLQLTTIEDRLGDKYRVLELVGKDPHLKDY